MLRRGTRDIRRSRCGRTRFVPARCASFTSTQDVLSLRAAAKRFGLPVAEAMLLGCPVIATLTAGIQISVYRGSFLADRI